jgi:oxygen-independent coproporphyrinogen III oxidase
MAQIKFAFSPSQEVVGARRDVPDTRPVESLYVHVPFCAHKCEYCAFYSAPPSGDILERYVQALIKELELVAGDCRPKTVFFGGGTPSLLTLQQWKSILQAMDRLNLLGADEWTVECNPATVSRDKAKLLMEYGVNRISMGVQSLNESLLERLGRVHSRSMVFRSFDLLREAGFQNLSIDLMFAIPGQTMTIWRETLHEALALGSEHLSCYEVIYEDDTPLYQQMAAGEFDVDEDLACEMYDELIDLSAEKGFRQYEVANFAREVGINSRSNLDPLVPLAASVHNMGYWRGDSCYAAGPSASEYVQGVRSRNWANTTFWIEQLERGRRSKEFAEALAPMARAGELAAFGLRMTAGWRFDDFQSRSGFDLRTEWKSDLEALVELGWGTMEPGRFRLTRAGLRFADAAGAMLLRPEAR